MRVIIFAVSCDNEHRRTPPIWGRGVYLRSIEVDLVTFDAKYTSLGEI
jgi:hypothetical protein